MVENRTPPAPTRLVARPISLRESNGYVAELHRHSKPVRGQKFSIGADLAGKLVGVVIVGRPVARRLDDGQTAEVLRLCTDGTPHVCSFLYGAAWRAARAMGYRRCVTYTLASEPGTSLRASGWQLAGVVKAEDWHRPSRARDPEHHDVRQRVRWEVAA